MTTQTEPRRGRRGLATAIAALALVAALAGRQAGDAAAGPAAQASKAASVDIDQFAYHPPALTVSAGTKVTFTNSSGVAHTATRARSFDTGRIKPGKSVSVRFGQKGTFAYHCKIHPFMHGKVVVK